MPGRAAPPRSAPPRVTGGVVRDRAAAGEADPHVAPAAGPGRADDMRAHAGAPQQPAQLVDVVGDRAVVGVEVEVEVEAQQAVPAAAVGQVDRVWAGRGGPGQRRLPRVTVEDAPGRVDVGDPDPRPVAQPPCEGPRRPGLVERGRKGRVRSIVTTRRNSTRCTCTLTPARGPGYSSSQWRWKTSSLGGETQGAGSSAFPGCCVEPRSADRYAVSFWPSSMGGGIATGGKPCFSARTFAT
jgi:hypothetical protein